MVAIDWKNIIKWIEVPETRWDLVDFENDLIGIEKLASCYHIRPIHTLIVVQNQSHRFFQYPRHWANLFLVPYIVYIHAKLIQEIIFCEATNNDAIKVTQVDYSKKIEKLLFFVIENLAQIWSRILASVYEVNLSYLVDSGFLNTFKK